MPDPNAKPPWIWAGLGFLLIAGLISVGTGTVTPPTTTTTPTTTPTTLPAGTYARPYGATATWNRPVSELGVHPRSAEFAARCFTYCNLNGPGRISTYFDDYSYSVYDERQATTQIRVYKANFGFQGSVPNGSLIPWNPAWKSGTAADNDKIVVIRNPATGKEIELWTTYTPGMTEQSTCLTIENLLQSPVGIGNAGDVLCVGQADVIQTPTGAQSDYRTATHTYPVSGAWMQAQIGLVTADEVAAGDINHALNLIVHNTMFGPQCSAPDLLTTAFGSTCGGWVNPASRLEWSAPQPCGANTQTNDTPGRSKTVPEGARFYLTKTLAQIETWLTSRGYAEPLKSTARKFAVAMKNYGMIVKNTSCFDAGVFTDGRINPANAPKWNALGIPSAASGLATRILDGLITQASDLAMAGVSAAMQVGVIAP